MRRLRREPVRGPGRIEFGRRGEHTLARPSPGRRGRGLGGERRRLTGEAASVVYPSRWAEVHCLSPRGRRSRSEFCDRGRASGRYPRPRRRRRLGRGHGRQRPPPVPALSSQLSACRAHLRVEIRTNQNRLSEVRSGFEPRASFLVLPLPSGPLIIQAASWTGKRAGLSSSRRRHRARRDSEPAVTVSPP